MSGMIGKTMMRRHLQGKLKEAFAQLNVSSFPQRQFTFVNSLVISSRLLSAESRSLITTKAFSQSCKNCNYPSPLTKVSCTKFRKRQSAPSQSKRNTSTKTTTSTAAPAATPEKVPEPSVAQLRLVALGQFIPFLGFGFMDNSILIIAGDAIDTSLGVTLGISTMCAAAIGNIVSDVAGIMLGTVIEDFCTTVLKLPVPKLTNSQRLLRSVRWSGQLGCAVGIVVGCIIGMFPLLFLDPQKTERKKRDAHLEGLFRDVVTEAKTLVGAESTCLFLRVEPPLTEKEEMLQKNSGESSGFMNWWRSSIFGSTKIAIDKRSLRPTATGTHLYAMYYVLPKHDKTKKQHKKNDLVPRATTKEQPLHGRAMSIPGSSSASSSSRMIPLGRGIVSRAALTGRPWNIYDVHAEPDFISDPAILLQDNSDGTVTSNTTIPSFVKNMVVVPVLDNKGRTIAVIQAMNKLAEGRAPQESNAEETDTLQQGFTEHDVQILMALASHISVSLQSFYVDTTEQDDEEARLKNTIRILKEHGLSGIRKNSPTADQDLDYAGRTSKPDLFPADA